MNLEDQISHGRDYEGQRVIGWFASEKMEGCFSRWDGSYFFTRSGHKIAVPKSFIRDMPDGIPLDGEIWCGRGHYEEARRAVQYGQFTPRTEFIAFDAPGQFGPWDHRIKFASTVCRAVKFFTVESHRQLRSKLRVILNAQGEGLMLRNPKIARYEPGRTSNLLKLKTELHL